MSLSREKPSHLIDTESEALVESKSTSRDDVGDESSIGDATEASSADSEEDVSPAEEIDGIGDSKSTDTQQQYKNRLRKRTTKTK